MHRALGGITFLACAAALYAPAQQTPASQQAAGLVTDWEIAGALNDISAHATRLMAALDKVNAATWIQQGASETYAAQLQSAKDQARTISGSAASLAANPQQLSSSLELLFRIQGLESMIASVSEAMRKYQVPADAQSLVALAAQNGENRDRLQRYIVNLAAEREKEYVVMDQEAQRCRGTFTAPPAPNRKKK